MEQGLAQQSQPQGGPDQERAMIDQVKQMLMQGATPEQLVAEGVPEQLIQIAIQELQQEMAQQEQGQIAQGQPVMDGSGQGRGMGLAQQV